MVGAMRRVDAVLQVPMCATGLDIKGYLHALRGKEEDARVEVDAGIDYCAKLWQAREGTYQLKPCWMWETCLSKEMQKWTRRTSDLTHGWMEDTSWWKSSFTIFAFSLAGFVCVGFVLFVFLLFAFLSFWLVKTSAFNFRFTCFANFW